MTEQAGGRANGKHPELEDSFVESGAVQPTGSGLDAESINLDPNGASDNQADIQVVVGQVVNLTDPKISQAARLFEQLEASDRRRRRVRTIFGGVIVAAAAGYSASLASGHATNLKFSGSAPFEQQAQNIINDLPHVLTDIGEGVAGAGLFVLGGVKLAARRSQRLKAIDEWSSHEMSADGTGTSTSRAGKLARGGLRNTVAGRVPIVLAGGVLLGSLSASIGEAVSQGPESAITAFTSRLPGDTILQEYIGGFTMTDNNISYALAMKTVEAAEKKGITALPFSFNLGQLTYNNNTLSDLALGVPASVDPRLQWTVQERCQDIPVTVDKSAGIQPGSIIGEDGITAKVVGFNGNTSATNRVGLEMALPAMQVCLDKSPTAPISGVALNTSVSEARAILQQVNTYGETTAVISKHQYEANSLAFWDSNVLPIISILEIGSLALVGLYAQRSSKEQLVRLRREWAAKSASGVSDNMIRGTEMLRGLKDGLAASAVGCLATAAATPYVVNSLVSGIGYSVGFDQLAVGVAIGIGGATLGAATNLVRPQKIIKVAENTRG